jgi:hypothetical protein
MNDLISRSALLAEYDRVHVGPPGGARKLIAEAPAVNLWIHASKPPEKDGRYLCRYRFRSCGSMAFIQVLDYYATDPIPHFQHTLGDQNMEVTHWMPLPEPPKGG